MYRPWDLFAVEVRHSWTPLWKSLYRFWKKRVWVILGIALTMLALDYFGALYQWEMVALDFLLRHNPGKPDSNYISVVEITDEDYKSFFCGRSPLDPGMLKNLILTVAKGEPSVIAVDLDVSGSDLPHQIDMELPELQFKTRLPVVVWAQVTGLLSEGNKDIVLKECPDECRAAAAGAALPDCERWGVPLFPLDRDGVVRRYQRWIEAFGCGTHGLKRSLPFAAFRIADPIAADTNAPEKSAQELIFRFTGDRYGLNITDVPHILYGRVDCTVPKVQWEPSAPPPARPLDFKGRIVLIGGDFDVHDRYRTPMGERAGIELMAHAIESEIRGGGFGETNILYSFLFDLAVGHMLLIIYYWCRPRHRLVFGFVAGVAISVPMSWVAFHFLAYWLSFVPVVCGVVIHEVREDLKEKRARQRPV